MEYNFSEIEAKWQAYWKEKQTYKTDVDLQKPKYYVLDMFPYPSGAGLHVGHPLGYIASDIYSRYKRLQGYNVLHPMGYDAYGLPAEQYAIQTGQHPAVTTAKNIARYREQLDKIGFCYDWDREIRTCEPDYYHWTQWAFIQMFNHYFDTKLQKAMPVELLVKHLEKNGTQDINAHGTEELCFTAAEWNSKSEKEQQEILLNYRIAYLADLKVNWCPALGTVLANDEVSEGLSIRGGHPVEQKVMRQWSLRVSAYAQRLLDGLSKIDWTDSLKETQKNWIGRSEGAEMSFKLKEKEISFDVFTTRADTIYGVTFMVLAPESELVETCTTPEQATDVQAYINATKKRTERERIADRRVTGVFSGSYAINPVSGTEIPIWISDYVLAGYGTGAIMAVPAHDSRDYAFAKHFNLPIIPLIEGCDVSEESFDAKEGIMMNSGFLNGLSVKEAIEKAKTYVEEKGIGRIKVNFRLRDAIFSRQRYWGEPFPVYYKDDMPYMLDESKLPLILPEVDKFLPTEKGEPPLGRAKNWQTADGFPLELCTMPGFAGSSAYYLRYMDPKNDKALVSKEANEYWRNVDLYIGGTEHATGHLVYSRFWNKFLFDLGLVCEDEPFKKLINQGMIQGRSNFVYRLSNDSSFFEDFIEPIKKRYYKNQKNCIIIDKTIYVIRERIKPINKIPEGHKVVHLTKNKKKTINTTISQLYVSYNVLRGLIESNNSISYTPIHVDVNIVSNDHLDIEKFRNWNPEYNNAEFILEDGKYICGWAVEKMSKSMFNVVNPDDIVERYGADTLRLYEMFLGPLEQSKPWDTNGIDGVHRFLKRLWSLFYKEGVALLNDNQPSAEELKILHKTIKKITFDIENFSFNTSVSAFMICVNELSALKCSKKAILEPLVILLTPFAPHIAEELYHALGHTGTVCDAAFPVCNETYLVESTVKYPISFNGKVRFTLELPADMNKVDVEKVALENENTIKQLNGATIKKVIVVPGKIVNIVI
jgi:leucyl-tRNA synthetase